MIQSKSKVAALIMLLALTSGSQAHPSEVNLAAENAAASTSSDECGEMLFEKRQVYYCIARTDRARNPDILFQFHGLLGSHFIWQNLSAFKKVRKNWQQMGFVPPTVVSLSMGPYWVLTDVQKRGALLSLFHNQVLPFFESYVGGLSGGKRLLLGESMGGYNALQLYLKFPQDYKRVAVLCPALPTIPYEPSRHEILAYAKRTGAGPIRAFFTAEMAHHEFSTREEWDAHNPFQLVLKTDVTAPKLYISAADRDGYGFFEGESKFFELAKASGRAVEFVRIANGRHCKMDPQSLSAFLASSK